MIRIKDLMFIKEDLSLEIINRYTVHQANITLQNV